MKKILIVLIPLLLNVYAVSYTPKKKEVKDNIYPVKEAKISSGFGERRGSKFHWGIDFSAPQGTPVIAPVDLEIIKIGWNENYGKYIVAKDDDNFNYLFAHLSYVSKLETKHIRQGQMIGKIGSSGYAFGPHLHYEISFNGVYFNPTNFSKKNFKTPEIQDDYEFLKFNYFKIINIL
jgi:murein DD-endopeptidase MepM/ murein hydrolase activator NlpD